jgi:hypothetical protein
MPVAAKDPLLSTDWLHPDAILSSHSNHHIRQLCTYQKMQVSAPSVLGYTCPRQTFSGSNMTTGPVRQTNDTQCICSWCFGSGSGRESGKDRCPAVKQPMCIQKVGSTSRTWCSFPSLPAIRVSTLTNIFACRLTAPATPAVHWSVQVSLQHIVLGPYLAVVAADTVTKL